MLFSFHKGHKSMLRPVGGWSAFGQHSACSIQIGLLGGPCQAGWACSTWTWQSRWAPLIPAWRRSAWPGRRSTALVPPWEDETLKSSLNMLKSPDQGVALPRTSVQQSVSSLNIWVGKIFFLKIWDFCRVGFISIPSFSLLWCVWQYWWCAVL